LELYRNFLAVYRAGSVSGAAKQRFLTQPAVSQQLAALEECIGTPLFTRTAKGMLPTPSGKMLHGEIFDPLDKIDRISRGFANARDQTGGSRNHTPLIRLGVGPDYFHSVALERLGGLPVRLIVNFGEPRDLIAQVEQGISDVAVTVLKPTSRSIEHRVLAIKRFVLVGSSNLQLPKACTTLKRLAGWLNKQPWIGYSQELPATRRFWQQQLGSSFRAELKIVAPDLRSVLRAVELGFGVSILPEYLCAAPLKAGTLQEIWSGRDLISSEQWIMAYRQLDSDRKEIEAIAKALEDC
jgi:DNA-binding transcriptional LysR family regulator